LKQEQAQIIKEREGRYSTSQRKNSQEIYQRCATFVESGT